MTLEELKAEAKKHGYKLTKEYPYVRLSPCICGHKRIGEYFILYSDTKETRFRKCYRCGFASEPARTKHEAKIKWNECVENARKEKENA